MIKRTTAAYDRGKISWRKYQTEGVDLKAYIYIYRLKKR